MDNVRKLEVRDVSITLEFDTSLSAFFGGVETGTFKIRGDKYSLQATTTTETYQREVATLVINEMITFLYGDIHVSIVFVDGKVHVATVSTQAQGKGYFYTLDEALESLARISEGKEPTLYTIVKEEVEV